MKRKLTAIILSLALTFSCAGCGMFRSAEPESTPSEMPDDFSLRFSWWYDDARKNIVDTAGGSIHKDLVRGGTASAKFTPEPDFLRQMYELVVKYSLADIDREMTSEVLAEDKSQAINMIPLVHYEVSVTLDGQSFLVSGDETASYHTGDDKDAANFINAVKAMKKAAEELPEWSSLPPADGGCD